MRVVEKFVSINGEGLRSGELAVFIRFANCNLRCSYCDTKYSFINPIYTEESIDEIVEYVKSTGVKNVTLTGGEPLIQNEIKELMIELSNIGNRIEIETNGSINIAPYLNIPNVTFTLDYKLKGSGMEKYMDLTNYDLLRKNDVIKFVVSDYDDLEYECESLKDEIDGAEDRLAECEEERDNLDGKYKSLIHQIEKLINDIYMEYIKPDDIVPALEKMI